MKGWRLLLTRPAEECADLARSLADVGIASSSLPLLHIEPKVLGTAQRETLHDLGAYQAIIVVSKPAARLLLAATTPASLAGVRAAWFTVGAATAGVLARQGIVARFPEQGDDSEALLALGALSEALDGPAPRVLIVRGEGGRERLAERLAEQGASVDYLELYRRCLPDYPDGELARLVDGERLNGLVVSSGQGFEHLHRLAGEAWPRLARLTLFAPSPRVADCARAAGAQHVVDCRGASAAALMAAVQRCAAPGS
ncbi:uroporphyrinogen-III synthase [Pseudomonas entomophila]|uniref:uroporphyrinogen-III synthase n=1 Tax=Pseudomonas entomophila TaxID=312306 RepID=UPI0015E3CFEE|nr:uroporphyrinogen-III synthase [Pseudomonas entomophila]MBA1189047.1 uroporphyrinogen-III synthase [Pseudomonas entomophila]